MITGSLQIKNGYYYVLMNTRFCDGTRKIKWESTGFNVKTPMKKVKLKYIEIMDKYNAKEYALNTTHIKSELLMRVPDYFQWYIDKVQFRIQHSTYTNYQQMINCRIRNQFTNTRLIELSAMKINEFYEEMLNSGLSPNTILRYNAVISSGCKYAYRHNIIFDKVIDKVDIPKAEKYRNAQVYSADELKTLFMKSKNDPLNVLIIFAAFYGLRRSEVLGLKWDAIDFEHHKMYIRHKITVVKQDGVRMIEGIDKLKNEKSMRELPLFSELERVLRIERNRQKLNQRIYGKEYNDDYLDYIFVDKKGKLIRPGFVTQHFAILLENLGLRKIRFHDLRHSCATLLVSNGVNMKFVQEWLGHSNMSTTADTYIHISFEDKERAGYEIQKSLGELSINNEKIV